MVKFGTGDTETSDLETEVLNGYPGVCLEKTRGRQWTYNLTTIAVEKQ